MKPILLRTPKGAVEEVKLYTKTHLFVIPQFKKKKNIYISNTFEEFVVTHSRYLSSQGYDASEWKYFVLYVQVRTA